MKKLIITLCILVVLSVTVYFALPEALCWIGINPDYDDGLGYRFSNKTVLIITTSHDSLGEGENAKPTGVYASELFVPYYELLDAGLEIDIASIKGGEIPIDPSSLKWSIITSADKRYFKDDDCKGKVENSLSVEDVDFSKYEMIFIAGGRGAACDLGYSNSLVEGITIEYSSNAIIGTVCHGSLGLINALDENGNVLIAGKNVAGVTNKQVDELGISYTPMHPETELIKSGANYQFDTAFRDVMANLTVIDGRIVSGQNQNASSEVARKMMSLLQNN